MFQFFPIGYVRNDRPELYQVPYQIGLLENMESVIELESGHNYEEALGDLQGMERIWVVFLFHKAKNWRPKITPPRGSEKKGLFATRSPHRPNPIGISAVKLKKIEGLKLYIEDHDIVDGTPVLDIKPYLPYVDSFPESEHGWLGDVEDARAYDIEIADLCKTKLAWISGESGPDLLKLIDVNLSLHPMPKKGNRISKLVEGGFEIAVKTWRVKFHLDANKVVLEDVYSGYDQDYLDGVKVSKWDDVDLHRKFVSTFCQN